MPKVTIGMPTYNRAKSLKIAIEQVLTQTYHDFEFIIYNDGSTDNTVNIVNSFSDKRIVFLNEKNRGLPHPLNNIIEAAKGEYIIILHDHDKFDPMLIEKSVKALDDNPEAGLVLQACAWINSDEKTGYQEFILDLPLKNNGNKFGQQLLIESTNFSSPFHACCMVRKSAYETVGKYYDENFGWYTDVDLWLRLLKEFNFIYLPEVLFVFTGREQNHLLSNKMWQISKWQHDIFLENTCRFFDEDRERKIALKKLCKKIKKNNFLNLIAAIVSRDKEMLNNGLEQLEQSMNYIFVKYLVKLLKHAPSSINLLMISGTLMNSTRKMIMKIIS